ncbi:bifunctional adenosylcobinamide kinase/adenosylcobinamide-phosphate guanylyltransferase [Thalassotalea piscium]
MIHLVMGGARSGKSSFAEQCVLTQSQLTKTGIAYIATATAFDSGMEQRIARHQQQRADQPWQLIECPNDLADCIENLTDDKVYLVECLTLWLSNMLLNATRLYDEDYVAIDHYLHQQVDELVRVLSQTTIEIVLVSNEVGQGVVPLGEINRVFVDHMGWLNQAIAKLADKVDFICAGIATPLKSLSKRS